MNITDYIIDIKDSSLADRLRLRQVLLDNGQIISKNSTALVDCTTRVEAFGSNIAYTWSGWMHECITNTSLQDFINKFKKHNQVRNLAIYKRSGEPWTTVEIKTIKTFVGSEGTSFTPSTYKWVYDDGREYAFMYYWDISDASFNNCLQIAYEDLFPQEQPMNIQVGSQWVRKEAKQKPTKQNWIDLESNLKYIISENRFYPSIREAGTAISDAGVEECKNEINEFLDTYEASSYKSYNNCPYEHMEDLILAIDYFNSTANAGTTTNIKLKETTMNNTTLNLIVALMTLNKEETIPDATNSKFVGIMMQDNKYLGYIYVNSQDEASTIMAKPENEGKQLHLFSKVGAVQQRPRKVQFTPAS